MLDLDSFVCKESLRLAQAWLRRELGGEEVSA
jgi:hypothetical protein